MASRSESDDPSERWTPTVDDVGAVALVWGLGVVVARPVFDYLLFGPGSDAGAPALGAVLGLVVVLTVGGVVVVVEARDPLDSLLEPTAPGDDSVWDEVLLFGVTSFAVGIVVAVSGSTGLARALLPAPLVIVWRHGLLVGAPLVLLALRRRGRLSYPDWIRADAWGLADDAALFGSTFLLSFYAVSSDYTLLVEPTAVAGVLAGAVAVALRRAGALVPDRRDAQERPPADGDVDEEADEPRNDGRDTDGDASGAP